MLQQASATGFLKMVLIILLIYYGIKILSKYLGPLLMKFAIKKASEKFGGQFQGYQQNRKTKGSENEGEVIITKIPKRKPSNKNVGDYVDYEEID